MLLSLDAARKFKWTKRTNIFLFGKRMFQCSKPLTKWLSATPIGGSSSPEGAV